MTGIYVRVFRWGEWKDVEFDQLTDEEMGWHLRNFDEERLKHWLLSLAQWIRDNVGVGEEQ